MESYGRAAGQKTVSPEYRGGQTVLCCAGGIGPKLLGPAAVDQHVQMHGIWLAGVAAFPYGLSDKAERHFGDGVDADEQAAPGRDTGVALRQQHGNPGQGKAQKVSSPIAQKNFASGPVDDEETRHRRGNDQAGEGQGNVPYLAGDEAKGRQHDEGDTGGQAVEAVNDVDGIGHTTHGKCCEQHGKERKAQQPVQPGNPYVGERYAGDAPAQYAGGHGGQQACAYGNPFGQVFQQAEDEGRHAGQQDGAEDGALFGRCGVVAGGGKAGKHANGNSYAADAGGGFGMELLYAFCAIDGEAAMPRLGKNQ